MLGDLNTPQLATRGDLNTPQLATRGDAATTLVTEPPAGYNRPDGATYRHSP